MLNPPDPRDPRDPRAPADTPRGASEQSLLVTKLVRPSVGAEVVPRPRLTIQLQRGFQRPLTLIAAPAGFGKTTLLGAWLQQAPLRSVWVSLDHDDNDLTRFWSYVFAALAPVHPGSGASGLVLRQASDLAQRPHIEPILTAWINDVATLPYEVTLVLDDYHLITAPAVHRSVTYLLDHLPHQLHLVLATRADPPLPLARLRTQGRLAEIRAADLRFTAEETATFLRGGFGLDLTAEDITALELRTEGWIAGLQLAALSMHGRKEIAGFLKALSGSHRYIIDYLVEEVLARQPEPVQTFLLRTAILERLQGSLCDAVIGAAREPGEEMSGQAMLEYGEQAHLFLIPLDDERLWYRYHHLFAEALRHRLQHEHPVLVPELHRRASRWYEQHDLPREAVHHALAASDFEEAARLIERAADRLVKHGELATLRAWLDALPDELVRSRMPLGVWLGWLLAQSGQFDAAEHLLQALEQDQRSAPRTTPLTTKGRAVQASSDGSPSTPADYAGRVAAIRAYIAFRRGDAPRTIDLARQALVKLREDQVTRGLVAWYLGIAYLWCDDLAAGTAALTQARAISQASGNSYAACMAAYELAQAQMRQGYLYRAEQTCQQELDWQSAHGEREAATGPLYVGRGDLQREWNLLDGAADSLQEGIARCQQTGNAAILLQGYIGLARVKQAQGDATGAETLIQQIALLRRTVSLAPPTADQVTAWQARLSLAQGDPAPAARWIQERQLQAEDAFSPARELEYATLARVLIALQRPDAALPLLARLLDQAGRQGRMGNALEYLVLQAVARQACGDEADALGTLARALALAEPEGYVRLFVDEGNPMARLLAQLRARPRDEHTVSADYREALLSLLGSGYGEGVSPSAGSGIHTLAEPLSQRELEVLRLIVAGNSNREIADRLVLAVSTVKWYVNAIYGKLQVQSRTKAIARARALNLD